MLDVSPILVSCPSLLPKATVPKLRTGWQVSGVSTAVTSYLLAVQDTPPPRRGGRPTKRTLRRLLRLARALRRGDPRTAACGAAGIGESTLRDWLKDDTIGRLTEALDRWESRGEASLVSIVRAAADTDPHHARWLLAVRRPAVYSQAGMSAIVSRTEQIGGVSVAELLAAKAAVDANTRPAIMVELNGVAMSPDEEQDLHDIREGRARVVRDGPQA